MDFCKIFVVFLCLFVLHCTNPSYAETIEGTSCDVETWEVLKNRAWMEGEREVEMAEVLILKPDSVLEYSCFNQRREELDGKHYSAWSQQGGSDGLGNGFIGQIITAVLEIVADIIGDESEGWGAVLSGMLDLGVEKLTNDSMDFVNLFILSEENYNSNSLEGPLGGHLENFSHSLAGGLHDGSYDSNTPCDAMNRVWDFVRCSGGLTLDSFMTLEALANEENSDIRSIPPYVFGQTDPDFTPASTYSMPPTCPEDVSATRLEKWSAAMEAANPPAAAPPELGGMHALLSRANHVLTEFCGDVTPVPTGIIIQDSPPGQYDPETENRSGWYKDAVCPAPGCHYVPYRLGGSASGACAAN